MLISNHTSRDMNHLQKAVAVIAGAVLLVTPFTLYAEGVAPQEGSTTPPSSINTPTAKINGQSGARGQGKRGTLSTTTGKDSQENGMKGGRMMATDTRVLPVGIGNMIRDRDVEGGHTGTTTGDPTRMRGRMMGTTSRDCTLGASSTDCASQGGAVRERIGEHRGEIFKHTGEMILKRMHAAVDRFNKIADRIDSRIAKMKAGGTDTTSAATALSLARAKIADAGNAVTEAENTINTVTLSLTSGTSSLPSASDKKPAKDSLEKARQMILAATQSLNDVIPLLVGNHGESTVREYASSTVSTGTPKFPGMMHTKNGMATTTSTRHLDTL